ncbi:hypothetical protein BDR22DRAFT_248530 [Usnea florida]
MEDYTSRTPRIDIGEDVFASAFSTYTTNASSEQQLSCALPSMFALMDSSRIVSLSSQGSYLRRRYDVTQTCWVLFLARFRQCGNPPDDVCSLIQYCVCHHTERMKLRTPSRNVSMLEGLPERSESRQDFDYDEMPSSKELEGANVDDVKASVVNHLAPQTERRIGHYWVNSHCFGSPRLHFRTAISLIRSSHIITKAEILRGELGTRHTAMGLPQIQSSFNQSFIA